MTRTWDFTTFNYQKAVVSRIYSMTRQNMDVNR